MVAPSIPRMAGHGVEIPPILLDVLAVVPLRARQPEGAFLEDRVAPVPQRQPQAQALLDVAEPGQAVLAPPVGAGTGVVVRQVAPGLTVRAVVFADRAPLALAHIGPPQVPVAGLAQPVLEPPEPGGPFTFCTHGILPVSGDRSILICDAHPVTRATRTNIPPNAPPRVTQNG